MRKSCLFVTPDFGEEREKDFQSEFKFTSIKMAFFLVDIKFREKAKHLLTTKEIYVCVIILLVALVNWPGVLDFVAAVITDNKHLDEHEHCSPKFKNVEGC